MTEALNMANSDSTVHSVYITGVGDYYSSGNDLTNFKIPENKTYEQACEDHANLTLYPFVDAFIKCLKPIVVGVNGHACGIMVTTLGLCDVVVASSGATFYTPFTGLA
jgi:peroxisomal 3,2-trans-enoyl-CoA isomerase